LPDNVVSVRQIEALSGRSATLRKPILASVVLLALLPTLGLADVSYEEETKMGGLMKIATFGKSMKSKTQVSGHFMRTDTDNEATIVDLDQEKIYTLDTKKKTYSVMTFEEMRQKMASAMAQAKQKRAEGGQEAPEMSASADIDVDETGRTENIEGYDCKQYLMTMDVTLSSEKEQQSATMSTTMEMWLSKDVPGVDEVQAFYVEMAKKLGTADVARQMFGQGGGEGQGAQFSANMSKMTTEMRKLDGFALRSVMYVGDPEAARKEAMGEKTEGGGLGGMLKKMGPFGTGGGDQGAEQGGTPGGVMMKMTTETKKIETKPIDPKVFAVPDNYKQVAAK
jgi:hypothetical protein